MNLSTIIAQLVAIVKADAAKTILPALSTFFTNLASNPSNLNLTVQLAQLQVTVMTELPTVEVDVLKQLASLTSAAAAAAAAPATPAA